MESLELKSGLPALGFELSASRLRKTMLLGGAALLALR
jgi:hypothetical protein